MPNPSSDGHDPREWIRHSLSWRPGLTVDPALDPARSAQLVAAKQALLALPAVRDAVLPGKDFRLALRDLPDAPTMPDSAVEVRNLGLLSVDEIEDIEAAIQQVNALLPEIGAALGPSLRLVPADVWCPGEAPYPYLGTSGLALAQIGAPAAHAAGGKGRGVVVVIVDQGINEAVLRKRCGTVNFGGGWAVREPRPGGSLTSPDKWIEPGTWPDGHGTRMAEAVLAVAPEATILDLPLLPTKIAELRAYLDWAAWIYWSMIWTIPWAKQQPGTTFKGPWVFCNAWSVYDLRRDYPGSSPWNYGSNPLNPLNLGVAELPYLQLADIVFAAGNGGQFCPDARCGPDQIGPGHSIYGVAALRRVLTVGAVRGDEIGLGYSAQGPAPRLFWSAKPDLVAPSQFTAPRDATRGYGGTSAACALAAGGFAALRSLLPVPGPSPAKLLRRAITTARPLLDVPPSPTRVGAGMLDLKRFLGPGPMTWTGEGEEEPPEPTEEPIA
ncbi:S8 family serine peptidase [Neoroseomonas soli]|uniref:S8 family peptidase n=1 Tax=Neoroseomonas soli TaxID=1081025 RepID=A0A9X9X1W1_9PROT|nr:S8 family serine peptidase [Neoroseomonas soli]MBR0673390.1 S8 family peptidase [Neoroseomonas soli]